MRLYWLSFSHLWVEGNWEQFSHFPQSSLAGMKLWEKSSFLPQAAKKFNSAQITLECKILQNQISSGSFRLLLSLKQILLLAWSIFSPLFVTLHSLPNYLESKDLICQQKPNMWQNKSKEDMKIWDATFKTFWWRFKY